MDANYYDHYFDPYYWTASKHPDIKPIVYIGAPCMVNLNSINTVREVLHHFELTNNLKKEDNSRQWTFLISDGVPYIYASLLQDRVLICKVCGEEMKGISCNDKEFALLQKEHEMKHECSKNLFKGLFSNTVLIPGPGHIELNMGRLLLKFL